MIKELASLQNEVVKKIASLKTKKYRKREGLYLLEGKRALEEAFAAKIPMESIFYTQLPVDWPENAETVSRPYYHVTEAVLKKITDTEDPQGVAAVLPLTYPDLADLHVEKDWCWCLIRSGILAILERLFVRRMPWGLVLFCL